MRQQFDSATPTEHPQDSAPAEEAQLPAETLANESAGESAEKSVEKSSGKSAAGKQSGKRTIPPPTTTPLSTGTNLAGAALLVALLVFLGVYVSLTALIVVLGLIFMIFLHETGHFVTARMTGMKASEFFIGFGPRLWSFKKGETEYGVRILPLGAYVRILGMSNLEEIPAEEESRTYRSKPYRSRLLVAVAGSTMHFILAFLVLWMLFSAVGYYPINTTNDEVYARWEITRVEDNSPASTAGFEPGDKIVGSQPSIAASSSQNFETYYDAADFIRQHPSQEVVFLVERDGELVALETLLDTRSRGEAGNQGWLGISSRRLDPPTTSIVSGFTNSVVEFGQLTKLLAGDFVKVFSPGGLQNLFDDVFGDDPEPAIAVDGVNGEDGRVVSIYGVGRLATNLGDSGNWSLLLFLYVAVNIFIGMFNLIPLPPFDGGHVAVATYEKLRSAPGKPYRIDAAKLIPLQYAVLALFIVIGVAALYLDVVDPIGV